MNPHNSPNKSRLARNSFTLLKRISSICLALAAASAVVQADMLNWDPAASNGANLGGAGTWDLNSTANWYNGASDITWLDNSALGTNSAIFGGTAGDAVTLNSNLSASNLQFTATGYTLSGSGTLTLGAGGVDASTLSSGTTTIGNALSLSGGQQLWKVGSGSTLAINGAVSRNTGAAVDFSAPGVTSSTLANDASGILGGWATVNGVSGSGGDWATISGGSILACSGYTAVAGDQDGSGASAQNWENAGGTAALTASATINSLNQLNDFTVNANTTLTLGSGGLLMAGNTSRWLLANSTTTSFLTSGAGNGELDVYVPGGTDNNWTIWPIIADNGSTPVTLVKNSAGMLKLRSINNYSGGTIVNAGILAVRGNDSWGQGINTVGLITPFGTGAVTVNNSQIQLGSDVNNGSSQNNNESEFDMTNAFVLNNGSTLWAVDGNQHIKGTVTIAGSSTLGATYNGGGGDLDKGLAIDGVVSGNGAVTVRQTGLNTGNTWNTSIIYFTDNANTYSGTITLVPMSGTAGGSYIGIGGSTALANATIDLSQGNNTSSAKQFGNSPVVFLTGIGSATLGALTGSAPIVLTGYNAVSHAYGSDSIALSIGNNNASTTYSGIISGAGSLTKTGNGTLTLSGVNTYTGNTTVNGGTLALTPGWVVSSNTAVGAGATLDISSLGPVTLSGSQTLFGGGTLNGALNTSSGSQIYADTDGGYGTNAITGSLTLASGTGIHLDLGTVHNGSNDLITVGGTLTPNNNIIHLKAPDTSVNLDSSADYVLFSSPNSISGSFAPAPTWDVAPANAGHYSIVTGANTVTLHYAAFTAPAAIGSATPSPVLRNQSMFITVTATNGTGGNVNSVVVDVSPIGGSSLALVEAGSSVSVSVWTNSVTVTPDTLAGGKTLQATVKDTASLSGIANISLTVAVNNDVWNGTGADSNFSTALNWTNLLAPGYVGDSLEFAAAAVLTPNVDNNYTVTGILFDSNAGAFNISSGNGSVLTLANAGSIVNDSANAQTFNLPVADSGGGLTKTGNGLITLSGNNTYTGPTVVNAGALNISGSIASTANVSVGSVVGNAVLDLSSSASISPYYLLLGNVSGSAGAVYQSGDTLINLTNNSGYDNLSVGNVLGAFGYYAALGGTINVNGVAVAGEDNTGSGANFTSPAGNGIMEVNGGTVMDSGWFVIARNNTAQIGELNIYSGSLTWGGTGAFVNNWGSGQTTMINVLGGTLATSNGSEIGFLAGTGIVNLLGGVTTAQAINGAWNGPNGQVSFNGGTLQASGDNGNFLAVTTANIYGGGATIDNNGNNVTIAQPLLAPTGNGITNASVTSGGAGYIAPPIITITNATGDTTGTGATAIAQINPLTGVVTNVIVTCPGVNYTATPVFVVSGGGATTPAVITGATPMANTSGGLTSIGYGTLTLAGVNTYTGDTVISEGTLALSGSGSINNSTNIIVGSIATFDVSALDSYTLSSGQHLEGSGSVNAAQNGSVATASGCAIYPGTDGTIGSLTFYGGLALGTGSTVNFDLSTNYNGANDQIVVFGSAYGGATLTLNGNALHIKAPSTLARLDSTADYVLITAGSIAGNFASTPVWDVKPVNFANFSIVTDPVNNQVRLHYSTLNPPTGSGVAIPSPAVHNQNVLISVTVTNGSGTVDPNTGVVLNASTLDASLSSVPLVLSSTISSTIHVYTNTITVPSSAAAGSYTLSAVITDSNGMIGTANILLVVTTTEVWNGGGSDQNWSTNPNWVSGMAPELSGDSLIFAGTVGTAPNMDNSYSVTGLAFSNNATSFNIGTANSSTLTLTANGIVNNSANAQTLNVPITMSGNQTFNAAAGNLTLAQGLAKGGNLVTVKGAANTAISGPVSDSGSLFKQDSGLLIISTNSTWDSTQASSGGFSGPLIAQAGTLAFNNGSSNTVTGELVIGGVVANGGAGNNAKIVVDNAALNVSSWFSVGRGNGVGGVSSDLVLTNGAVVTAANFSAGYNGGSSANLPKGSVTMNNSSTLNITGNGAVNFAESTGSAFTMTLNGASQFIGAGTGVKSLPYSGLGTVTLNDSSMIQFGNAVCYVGHNYGTGVVTVASSSAAFYNGGELQIGGSDTSGTGPNANGTFILNAGTVGVGALTIGRGNNNQNGVKGVLYINGGTFTCTNDVLLAYAGANTTSGKIAMNGGTLNVGTTVTKWLRFGQYDYTSGEIDITNGNLNLNTGTSIKYNQNGSTGPKTFNQYGGNVTFYSDFATTPGGTGNLDLMLTSTPTGTNTYNLNGGTLSVPQIISSSTTGSRIFNFNGGTLKAVASNTSFLNLGTGSATANVRSGGAIIDTAGFNVTIPQALVNNGVDLGGGLTKLGAGTLKLTGANTYTGNTTVNGGTLELAQATLATNSTVSITNGAVLQLDFAGMNTVTNLVLNGVTQAPGVYSSNSTPAYIAGPGSLVVPGSGPGTFTSTPGITSFTLNGADIVISGTNGQAGDAYYLLESTNVALPLSQWACVATNVLGAGGSFTYTGTNAVTAGNNQQFYILSNTNSNH